MPIPVKFRRIHPDARLPSRAHDSDVGFDLYAVDDAVVYTGEIVKVSTGLQFQGSDSKRLTSSDAESVNLPVYCKIEPRSGLASQGVIPVGGIIDPGYRGELVVLIANMMKRPKHEIRKGDRIAQLVFYPVVTDSLEFVLTEEEDKGTRGAGGFGSTGA